ncbi:MAG TPA: hypothetical protein DCY03_32295 [Planctomycetaceae bacterium]|nr:hypothetical protein [Planctomycetaceae bacterium]|tara:strand:- start:3149 stop:3631 length:483 start_codon:yes stop_codon:yes gene_type:complete
MKRKRWVEAAPDTVSENEPQLDWTTGLEGTWKSDWPLTKQHLEADCNLSAEATLGLERLLGKMTVQYDGHRAIYTMPEIRYIKAGKEYILAGWTREEPLHVLGRTSTQLALLTKAVALPVDQDYLTLLTFENADTCWLYLGYSPLVDLHVKEYFCRVVSK